MNEPIEQQAMAVIKFLDGKRNLPRDGQHFAASLAWIANAPATLSVGIRNRLLKVICTAFSISEQELYGLISTGPNVALNGHVSSTIREKQLESELRQGGWLSAYAQYTRNIEPPLSYNLFSSLCVLGCALGRRVWINKGPFRIYPACRVLLIGPPALKKTTCADIAKTLIKEKELCPIFADKMTPEAIIKNMQRNGSHQFVFAGELSFFLGKQKYNEGLIALLLNLLEDREDEIRVETATHGEQVVAPPAITMIGCSTPSLLSTATPEQVSSSGFLGRFMMISESICERVFWEPSLDMVAGGYIRGIIHEMKELNGGFSYSAAANSFCRDWYMEHKHQLWESDNDTASEIKSRTPIHMERIAMLLHAADCGDNSICLGCVEQAIKLAMHSEKQLPTITHTLETNAHRNDADYILGQLRKRGGTADHSTLLRYCSNRINSNQFRQHISTLKEANQIHEEKRGIMHFYTIVEAEDENTQVPSS